MEKRSIKIRVANKSDSSDIWNWRNDSSTRVNSLNQDFVEWDDHQEWFQESIRNGLDFIYIGELQGEKIGMCRFKRQINSEDFEVSINLNPLFRGQHLSRELLQDSINELFMEDQIPHSLTATVRETNLPSVKLFQGIGFELVQSSDGIVKFELQNYTP